MKLKIAFLAILCITCLGLAEEPVVPNVSGNPAAEASVVKDGYALLDSLLTLFENLPAEKGLDAVHGRLAGLSGDAKAALEANQIDTIFYNRYRRMLTIFKLIVMPMAKNEILEPVFMKTFADFVHDVTFETWTWGDKESIGKMAAAMEEEFVQLHLYLDDRAAREELKKKIGQRILPPPPPPPGSKKEKK